MNPFRTFVVARAICWAGNAVTLVALPLLVYQRSGSALLSGVTFAVESLPYLLFGLFAGAVADRFDRKSILVVAQMLSAVALASIPVANVAGDVLIVHALTVAFLVSTLFVFYDAASFGVVPALVGRDRIADATGTLVSVGTVIGIAGPLLGGVAATALSPAGAIAIDACCYLSAAALTATIAIPPNAVEAVPGHRISDQIGEGLRYIWQQPVVRALTLVGIGVSLANGVVVGLMVVVGVRRLGLGDGDARLGALYAATALGAFLISLVSAKIQRVVDTGKITLAGIAVSAGAMLLWAQTPWFVVSLVILVVYQAANTMIIVNGIVVRQSITPDELQSRVNTTARMIAMGGTPFGAAMGGAVAQVGGVGVAVSAGAVALLCSAFVGWRMGVARLPLLADLTPSAHGKGE
ncbi:transmembrane secretion effector [Williamsia muralis]|uniref:Transmembrane secretion effector n=1 Tax=Williamsia marianensis TaxID=85044 RepID=A0A495K004_WILMA|nr:MFS transporter [Williamsia muralis]RKR93789.1 transmembrane secretion effector [Williamsia muralis]